MTVELLRIDLPRYEHEGKLKQLLTEIQKRRIRLEDRYEIAAILESDGWTDTRAAEEFGVGSVFALAADLWDIAGKDVKAEPLPVEPRQSVPQYILMVTRSFMKGMIFALPMAISIFAMLTLRFSLWSFENLSVELATAIAIGTIMSFMAIGGFTQAIARRGYLYVNQGYYNMARRITFYFVRMGYMLCLLFSAALLLFNSFFGMFPHRITLIMVVYFLFLSAIWLSVTIMYILEKEIVFTGLLAVGILIVYLFYIVLQLDIILSQLIALIIVSTAGYLIALYLFTSAERKMDKGIIPLLPRSSIIVYSTLPYFGYGFLYFSFLFLDRIVAWSTNTTYMPYLIWFRGPYELGLDLALLTMIVPMGFIEVVVKELMVHMEVSQKNYMGRANKVMNKAYIRMYIKRMVVVAVFAAINAVAFYYIVSHINLNSVFAFRGSLISNEITSFVFTVAVIAYNILCIGMMNALVLFCLSQPEMAGRAVLTAILANCVIGFLLSRWIDHQFAVVGLLCGCLVFLVITSRLVFKVLKELDYYLYATS